MTPDPTAAPRAVLMDLDGTLYHHGPLRRRILAELAQIPLRCGPRAALRILRRLATFRRVREELRELGRAVEPLATLQYELPARRLGDDPRALEATVREWIHQRPLRHLRACRRRDLLTFLERARGAGLPVGVFSDYPAEEKLVALGVGDAFCLSLCATDPEVNAFKPHPRGFQLACQRLELDPCQVLYVGDRPEIDGAGAAAAGMPVRVLARDAQPWQRAADLDAVWRSLHG